MSEETNDGSSWLMSTVAGTLAGVLVGPLARQWGWRVSVLVIGGWAVMGTAVYIAACWRGWDAGGRGPLLALACAYGWPVVLVFLLLPQPGGAVTKPADHRPPEPPASSTAIASTSSRATTCSCGTTARRNARYCHRCGRRNGSHARRSTAGGSGTDEAGTA